MERLSIDEVIEHCKRHTERIKNHSGRMQLEETPIGNSNIMKQYWEHRQVAEWLEQLKDYKDAEEQGLLLRLPCKVGDTVYKLWYKPCHNGEDYPDSYSCCGCEDECDLKRSIFAFTIPSLAWILQHIGRFGEGVWYLKREEAEQALKRMESE